MSYYAVAKGRNSGIYSNWDDCKEQVHKYSAPVFKKFNSQVEAESFMRQNSDATSSASDNSESYSYSYSYGSSRSSSIPSLSNGYSGSQSKDKFILDKNGYTEVYTDGACTSNGRNNAKAGVGVWFNDDNSFNVSRPVVGRATNNKAEIEAVISAAKQAQKAGIKKLKINTDSKFIISCKNEWMPKWKQNGWRTSDGKDVINKPELLEMEKALKPLQVEWNYVPSHVGIHGNEMADKLARSGSENYKRM